MIGIFIAKFQNLYRRPWTFISMMAMSIVFALVASMMDPGEITIPAYFKGNQNESQIVELIEANELFSISWFESKEQLESHMINNKSEFGMLLSEENFQLIIAIESPNIQLFEQQLEKIYRQQSQFIQLEQLTGEENVKSQLSPVFQMERVSFEGEESFIYDNHLFRLFGFTLFFVIYTIAYSVVDILIEKRSGVWDRLILSSVRKWEMYAANYLYSILVGYFHILIVLCLFKFVVKINFYGAFGLTLLVVIPYVLAIVSLAILLTGIVKTIQQFNAVIPIVAVSMAMIGGAYWPLEIVQSKFLLLLAKVNPIKYGIDALQGVTIYGQTIEEVMLPIAVLLFMSVLMTGIGIHLMERRYVD